MKNNIWNSTAKILLIGSIAGMGVMFSHANITELFAALSIEAAKGGVLGITEIIKRAWSSGKNGAKNKDIQDIFLRSFVTACNQIKQNYLKEKTIYKNIQIEKFIKKLNHAIEENRNLIEGLSISDKDLLENLKAKEHPFDNELWKTIETHFIKEGIDKEFSDYFRIHFQPVLHDVFLEELIRPESTEGWRAFNNLMLESIHQSITNSNEINNQNQEEILNKISSLQKQLTTLSYKQISGRKSKIKINYPDFVYSLRDQNKIIIDELGKIKSETSISKDILIYFYGFFQKFTFFFIWIKKNKWVLFLLIIGILLIIPQQCKDNREIKKRDDLIENFSQYISGFDKYIDRGEIRLEEYNKDHAKSSKEPITINMDNPQIPEGLLDAYLTLSRSECLKFKKETTDICKEISPHFSIRVEYMLQEVEDFASGAKTPSHFEGETDPYTGWESIYNFQVYENGSLTNKTESIKSKIDVEKFKKLINLLLIVMKEEAERNMNESVFTSSFGYKIYGYIQNQVIYPVRKISFKLDDLKIHENIWSWCPHGQFFAFAISDSLSFYILNISQNNSKNSPHRMYKEIRNQRVFSFDNKDNYIKKGDQFFCFAISSQLDPHIPEYTRIGPITTSKDGSPMIIGVFVNIPGYKLVRSEKKNIWASIDFI